MRIPSRADLRHNTFGLSNTGDGNLGDLQMVPASIKPICRRSQSFARFVGICFLAALAGCASNGFREPHPRIASELQTQSWTSDQSYFWSTASAGSRLLPYSWYLALEQAGSTEQFSGIDHMQSFGYLRSNWDTEPSLPVGFAVDRQKESGFSRTKLKWYASQQHNLTDAEPWIGLNCAACHTKEIKTEKTSIRVYGGDGQGDLQALVQSLISAGQETLDVDAKWIRFSRKVLADKNTSHNRALLRSALSKWLDDLKTISTPGTQALQYGPGRTDAFGQIFNTLQRMISHSEPSIEPENAAVNYPVLWNIHRQKHLQWNGYAINDNRRDRADRPVDTRALGRNIGAIIGSYGDIAIAEKRSSIRDISVDSSIHFHNIVKFENLIRRLDPPRWPSAFPDISPAMANRGRKLYDRHCVQCHARYDQLDLDETSDRRLNFWQTPARHQTDIWAACNIFAREGPSGILEGKREFLFAGARYKEWAPMHSVVSTLVWAAAAQHLEQLIPSLPKLLGTKESKRQSTLRTDRPSHIPEARVDRRNLCIETEHPLLGYKARPLDGIWSSAPYLHNGSVPTLYDLLLPAAKRPDHFMLGDRQYDFVKLGVSKDALPGSLVRGFRFETRGPDGKEIPGNSNAGHEYGVDDLNHDDRLALIEYLKGL